MATGGNWKCTVQRTVSLWDKLDRHSWDSRIDDRKRIGRAEMKYAHQTTPLCLPRQRSEAGMAFRCFVGCRRAFTWFVADKGADPRAILSARATESGLLLSQRKREAIELDAIAPLNPSHSQGCSNSVNSCASPPAFWRRERERVENQSSSTRPVLHELLRQATCGGAA